MEILKWFGLQRRAVAPADNPLIPSRTAISANVSAGEAFSLSMVFRAVQIVTTSITQLPLDALKRGKVVASPLLVQNPDINETRPSFLEMTTVSLAIAGNAYWKVTRNPEDRDTVTNLEVMNPLDVVVNTSPSGRITGYTYQGRDMNVREVRHLKFLRVPGSAKGLGPIQAAQSEIRGALDLRNYSAGWFTEAAIPNGVLTSANTLSPEQAADAKRAWHDSHGAKRGVAVLGNGMSYAPVYLNPRDAMFIESQNFTVTQIARLFGVPSSLMLASVEGSTDTYQNVAQDWLGFVRFSLMSYLTEIEEALSGLLPKGMTVRFNVEALLRSDTVTRYTAHKLAIEAGFMSVNEVRAIENLPALANIEGLPRANAA